MLAAFIHLLHKGREATTNCSIVPGKPDQLADEEAFPPKRFPLGMVGWNDKKIRKIGNVKSLEAGSNGAQVYLKTGHFTDKQAMSMESIQTKED